MKQEKFDLLVKKLESYARKNPKAYQMRVRILALLGYLYILLVVALIIALVGLLIWAIFYTGRISGRMIQLIIFLIIPIGVILRSLWVSLPPPIGLQLNRQQVPQLFALLDELSKALQVPRFHRVLLTPEFNAGVVQIPRWGFFGGQQNYLLLGLPLMQALSPQEFRAVIAHELGHISGNHSRFAAWIYRQRQTWMRILYQFQQSQHEFGTFVFEIFLNWYAPFFQAYSFVLARANEYEADRCAAELAGEEDTARALMAVALKGERVSQYWSDLNLLANSQPEPPKSAFQGMAKALTATMEPETEKKWLKLALAEETNNQDTHPCLSDRLAALNYSANQLPPPAVLKLTAAEQFLGAALGELTETLDGEWRTEINFKWRERYTYVKQARESLEALDQKAISETLSVEEAWERARCTLELKGDREAEPLLEAVIEKDPDFVNANFELGRILIAKEDERGIELLEKAMAKEANLFLSGCQLIYTFLKQQERQQEAEEYRQRAQKHQQLLLLASQERASITKEDKFQPHQLSAEVETQLEEQLAKYSEIEEVYLVQKVVQYLPEKPFYILGVKRRQVNSMSSEEDLDRKLADRLQNEINFPVSVCLLMFQSTPDRNLKQRIKKAAVKPLYQSSSKR